MKLLHRLRGLAPILTIVAFGVVFAAVASWAAPASPPPAQAVYGYSTEETVETFTAHVVGTVNSPDFVSYGKGVYCTYAQSASSGSPSTTIAVQAKDSASATYETLVTSGAITAGPTGVVEVYPGIQTSTIPANMTAISLALPKYWRLVTVIGGTGTITGTVGCSVIP
jgi:hypothetical protein